MYPSIIISNKAARLIESGGLWIPKSEVVGRKPSIAGIVHLLDKKRKHVGSAFCSPKSKIFLRIITKYKEEISEKFWREKFVRAYHRRKPMEEFTDAYRIVYSESDQMPSIIVDKYAGVFALQITSEGAETIKDQLIKIIKEECAPLAIVEKNKSSGREEEGLSSVNRLISGESAEAVVREFDKKFKVNILEGQKTGAYLDYRSIRLKAKEYAKGKCLDAFCYEGWFACHVSDKAENVVAVDISEEAIARAVANAELNKIKNIEFVRADVFDYLENSREEFDFIHLDPPSFVKSFSKIKPAVKGYEKLVESALKLIKKGGIVLVSSCSHFITERILEESVAVAVKKSGMQHKIVARMVQDKDHPILRSFPESLYLKAVAFQVL